MLFNLLKNTAVWSVLVLVLAVVIVFYGDFKEAKARKETQEWAETNKIVLANTNASLKDFRVEFDQEEWNLLLLKLNHTKYFEPLDEKYAKRYEFGFDPDYARTLVDYWRTQFDWQKQIESLNRYPQSKLVVNNDINIHFIHYVTNAQTGVKPIKLIMFDGWPGFSYSYLNCIDYIQNNYKTLSFDIIVPSIPGYGYSTPLRRPFDAVDTAQYFDALMRFVHNDANCEYFVHGEDWGSVIASTMAKLYPNRVKGIHITMPTVKMHDPVVILYGLLGQISAKLVLTHEEYDAGFKYGLIDNVLDLIKKTGYFHYQSTAPDTLATAFTDSPVGLLAYILEKYAFGTFKFEAIGTKDALLEKLGKDRLLTILTHYWMTNTISSSMRFYKSYWYGSAQKITNLKVPETVPVGIQYFKNEVTFYPIALVERFYPNLQSYHIEKNGGHFANFENPDLTAKDFVDFVTSAKLI